MHPNITTKDLQTLLLLYNQQIDTLKEKLINGESWENLKPLRRNISELGIGIQKLHGLIIIDNPDATKTHTRVDKQANQPVD